MDSHPACRKITPTSISKGFRLHQYLHVANGNMRCWFLNDETPSNFHQKKRAGFSLVLTCNDIQINNTNICMTSKIIRTLTPTHTSSSVPHQQAKNFRLFCPWTLPIEIKFFLNMWKIVLCAACFAANLVNSEITKPRVSLGALMIENIPLDRPVQAGNSIKQQGPDVLLGMRFLRETYGHVFNFSHSFLPGTGREGVVPFEDATVDFVGRFYFQHDGHRPDATALISPCELPDRVSIDPPHRNCGTNLKNYWR